jgi:hypothetical protein
MAKVVTEWVRVAERSLAVLFSGNEQGIAALTNLIKDGTFVAGAQTTTSTPSAPSLDDVYEAANQTLTDSVAKLFFAYAIPAIWTQSGAFPFVVDSGVSCDFTVPLVLFVAAEMLATRTCVEGKWYYLSGLEGSSQVCFEDGSCEPNHFSVLHGIEALQAGEYGGVTPGDIIRG